jgi:hypothetical protein
MKKIFESISRRFLLATLLATATLLSCSKWDDYKKYTANGEIIYTGKLDSVKAFSGKNRVRITGKFNADPKISTVKIFWNSNRDSLVYDVKPGTNGNVFDQTFPLPESITTFTIYTYDAAGNKSVPVYVVGKSFGDVYRKKISNRVISSIRYMSNNTTINWEAADPTLGAYATEVLYVVNGVTKSATSPAAQSTVLDGLNTNTPVKFRGIYKPDSTSIDTFAVPYRDTVLIPLKNARIPFIASSRSGRWGNLAEWNTNDAAKNHGGYGGWDEWNENIFNVESGWGAPAVTNGKIWQSILLEPGTYTFEISDLRDTNIGSAESTYLVANLGTDLPDIANIATALGSTKVATGKPLSDLRVKFTVTQQSMVSVGYLTTQAGSTPGRYCNIRAFSLYTSN